MIAYSIDYKIKGKGANYSALVNAKDIKSAKKKIGKKHKYVTGRMIQIQRLMIIGYY